MRTGESVPSSNPFRYTEKVLERIAGLENQEQGIASKALPSEAICEQRKTREPNAEKISNGKQELSRMLNNPTIIGKNHKELMEYCESPVCPQEEKEPIRRFLDGVALELVDCKEYSYKLGQDTFNFYDTTYSKKDKDNSLGDLLGEPETRPEGYRGVIKTLAYQAARQYNRTQSGTDKMKYLTELDALAKIFRGDTIGNLRLKMEIDNTEDRTREVVSGRQSLKLTPMHQALNEVNSKIDDLKKSCAFYKNCCDASAEKQ